jgi:cathepsin E
MTAGILDTGTTLILLATGTLLHELSLYPMCAQGNSCYVDAYDRYCNVTGAVVDSDTQLLIISEAQLANLNSLFFTIGNSTFELTPKAQIFPPSLNTYIGLKSDYIYLIVNDIGTPSGAGLDFISGYTFLERFYTVYDTGNRRVGLATTPFTMSNSN